jgi:dienelactone hydrolase
LKELKERVLILKTNRRNGAYAMKSVLFAIIALSLSAPTAIAKVVTRAVTYKDAGTELKGFFAWDDAKTGKRPGILLVHEWWGLNDYAKMRAKKLAALGYVAFALDMYGEGKVTEHPQEAGQWAGMIRKNQKAWQQRALAGLKILKGNKLVDTSKLAAIGYCFGGATALELAYSGADLKAVVTFHGALPTPTEEQAKQIKARIVICHGASDKFIGDEAISKLQAALTNAHVDWEMISYAGAVHSFSVPGADKRKIPGIAYNKKADERSWRQMKLVFGDVFGK